MRRASPSREPSGRRPLATPTRDPPYGAPRSERAPFRSPEERPKGDRGARPSGCGRSSPGISRRLGPAGPIMQQA
jgi:hypothetical protein